MKKFYVCLLTMGALALGARGEEPRTDINPALRYWSAFLMAQRVPQADHDQLLTNEWRGQPLPPKFGELVSGYNQEFRLFRAAAHAQVACDWGLDLTEGPELLLPHLAVAKGAVQVSRLRAMWDLQNGKPDDARDDLLAALALARHLPQDGTLISVLVEIAVENIIISTVAENFYQLPSETLQQLDDGFSSAPARGTISQAVQTGERSFYLWFLRKVQEAQKKHPGDDAAAMTEIRALFEHVLGTGENGAHTDVVERSFAAAGGTSDGLARLITQMAPVYDRAVAITAMPLAEYETNIAALNNDVQNTANPLVGEFFPALMKAQPKEFAILSKIAMLHAVVEYKLHGDAGFKSVIDPAGNEPFTMERFIFEGVDRGFKVKSTYAGRGYPEVMIFVEKDGTPFFVDGLHAGEALPKPGSKQ